METIKAKVINNYLEVTAECSINQLGPPYTYYYADELNTNLLSSKAINIDIKSAFPTICKILFGKDSEFVKKIDAIEEKLPKIIYLTNTLNDLTKKDGYPYLTELNLWSKILILSYVYSKYNNISILEYVKDGMIINASSIKSTNKNSEFFNKLIQEYDIEFHEEVLINYCRFNKTSIYQSKDKLKIKGKYHDPPKYIQNVIAQLFSGKIFDNTLLTELKYIYTEEMFNFCYYGGLSSEIDYYYKFKDNKFISDTYNLDAVSKINIRAYLTELLFPIIALLRTSIV